VGGDALVAQPARPGLQVQHLLRKLVGRMHRVGVQRRGGAHVAAWRAAHAEVDAPGRQRVQHAKLLGHLQRRVVRQHHAGAADAHARGARGNGGHQHLGRAAHDGGHAMVLADPESPVAQRFAMCGQVQRVAQGVAFLAAGAGDRLVKH